MGLFDNIFNSHSNNNEISNNETQIPQQQIAKQQNTKQKEPNKDKIKLKSKNVTSNANQKETTHKTSPTKNSNISSNTISSNNSSKKSSAAPKKKYTSMLGYLANFITNANANKLLVFLVDYLPNHQVQALFNIKERQAYSKVKELKQAINNKDLDSPNKYLNILSENLTLNQLMKLDEYYQVRPETQQQIKKRLNQQQKAQKQQAELEKQQEKAQKYQNR